MVKKIDEVKLAMFWQECLYEGWRERQGVMEREWLDEGGEREGKRGFVDEECLFVCILCLSIEQYDSLTYLINSVFNSQINISF